AVEPRALLAREELVDERAHLRLAEHAERQRDELAVVPHHGHLARVEVQIARPLIGGEPEEGVEPRHQPPPPIPPSGRARLPVVGGSGGKLALGGAFDGAPGDGGALPCSSAATKLAKAALSSALRVASSGSTTPSRTRRARSSSMSCMPI